MNNVNNDVKLLCDDPLNLCSMCAIWMICYHGVLRCFVKKHLDLKLYFLSSGAGQFATVCIYLDLTLGGKVTLLLERMWKHFL